MELSQFSDYSLRVLMFAGCHSERLSSVGEISEAYGISRNHLVKVVHRLAQFGYLRTVRGRGGGLELGKEPGEIVIGEVVRRTESFGIVECFREGNRCGISGCCLLKGVLAEAREAFLRTLDGYTLVDLLKPKRKLMAAFAAPVLEGGAI